MMPKVQGMADRLLMYDSEFAVDYAPVLLSSDGKTVVDGNHRAAAHKIAGLDEMLVMIPRNSSEKSSEKSSEEEV
jgi:hypothetical protein